MSSSWFLSAKKALDLGKALKANMGIDRSSITRLYLGSLYFFPAIQAGLEEPREIARRRDRYRLASQSGEVSDPPKQETYGRGHSESNSTAAINLWSASSGLLAKFCNELTQECY